MNTTSLITLILLAALLPACVTNYRPATVRQTVTRPIVYSSSRMGSTITTEGVETIVTEQPYQSPAYLEAGRNLFSR